MKSNSSKFIILIIEFTQGEDRKLLFYLLCRTRNVCELVEFKSKDIVCETCVASGLRNAGHMEDHG